VSVNTRCLQYICLLVFTYVEFNKLTPSLFTLCSISSSVFCTNFFILCPRLGSVFYENLLKFCNSNVLVFLINFPHAISSFIFSHFLLKHCFLQEVHVIDSLPPLSTPFLKPPSFRIPSLNHAISFPSSHNKMCAILFPTLSSPIIHLKVSFLSFSLL